MHPLLARALEMGVHADGLSDASGFRLRVEERGGVLRGEVRGADGESGGVVWRSPPAGERPPGLPRDVPFLPGLSSAAVRDRTGLTVHWPAPPPSMAVPGGASLLGGVLGSAPSTPPDPVGEAWRRFSSEGSAGDGSPRLREALEALVGRAAGEGWRVVEDETIGGVLEARVVRMRRPGARRSLTLSRALGVASLVMLEAPAGEER